MMFYCNHSAFVFFLLLYYYLHSRMQAKSVTAVEAVCLNPPRHRARKRSTTGEESVCNSCKRVPNKTVHFMDRLSIVTGILGLLVALFPPSDSPLLFAAALVCIALSVGRLVSTPILLQAVRLARGRIPLLWVLDHLAENSTKREYLLAAIVGMAREGRLTIYGERGGSRLLASIDKDYFKSRGLMWGPGLLQSDETDPNDERYFNLHIKASSIPVVREATVRATQIGDTKSHG